jgi:hypothetical protein
MAIDKPPYGAAEASTGPKRDGSVSSLHAGWHLVPVALLGSHDSERIG